MKAVPFSVRAACIAVLAAGAFAQAPCGSAGRLQSIVPLDGGCVGPGVGSNVVQYDVQQGKTYRLTLVNVTDEGAGGTAPTINLMVKNSDIGNTCWTANQTAPGTYVVDVTMPLSSCNTFPLRYGTFTNCSGNPGRELKSDNGGCNNVHLRAAQFGPGCSNPTSDVDCGLTTSVSHDLGGGCGFPGPRLHASFPHYGGFGTLAISDADPTGQVLLFVDPAPFDVPFFRITCLVLIDPFFSLQIGPSPVDPSGTWSLSTPLPALPELIDFSFLAQAAIFAPGGPVANAVYITNGVQVTIGSVAPYVTRTAAAYAGNGAGGAQFDQNFVSAFPNGLTVGDYVPGNGNAAPNGLSWGGDVGGLTALKAFLGSAAAPAAALADDALDPSSAANGGVLAQETATLALNIGFSAAGVLGGGNDFGSVVHLNPGVADALNGYAAGDLLVVANQALAGFPLPAGYTYASLAALLADVNASFADGVQSTFSDFRVFNPKTP